MMPYYEDDRVTLHHGDCLDVLRTLPDCSVDSVCTDPPYGLEFMGKEWDGADGFRRSLNASDAGRDNAFGRTSRTSPEYRAGSSFQQWCEAWAAECLRVLKPGGHLLAFGGTRTWHRLACAVEDAGFEVRDSIAWLYGSGFPKSLDVSKAIDKQRTEDRAPVDAIRRWLNERRLDAGISHDAVNKHFGHASNGGGSSSAWMTNPTSRALPTWEQWQELRALFDFGDEMDAEVWRLNDRKGTPGEAWQNAEVIGVREGAMAGWAMDGTTKFVTREDKAPATPDAETWQGWGTALKPAFEPVVVARKPLVGTVSQNVLTHGTGALNIDGCRIGTEPAFTARRGGVSIGGLMNDTEGERITSGGAGRWPANVVLDESQAEALDRQSGIRRNAGHYPSTAESVGMFGDRRQGDLYADKGGASRFFYVAKAPKRERPRTADGTAHPTVKPLALMRWLVRLVTPPGGVVLEPFAGSGTTVEACILEGFQCIAIEREADYLPLIEARIARQLAAQEQAEPDLFDLLGEETA